MTNYISKKKVLFLITKSNWGGAQRYVHDLAAALPDTFEPVVMLGGDGPLTKKLAAAGIRVIPIPGLTRDISLMAELRASWHIGRIIQRERPDVLHVNSSKAGGIGTFIGRLLGVPRVVFTAHGWAFNEDRPGWQRFLITYLHWLTVLFSHVTITVSDAVRAQLAFPFVRQKMVTVHNGRDVLIFLEKDAARARCVETEPRLDAYRDDIWTGTIAELHRVKRHDIAIEAIRALRDEGIPVRHAIIGTGEEQAALAALVREHQLEEHVFFLGHVDEAAALLRAFDIFILASRSEALAYTVVEAAQAGLPIVASNVGGLPEIITNEKNGLLVPREDSGALAGALRELISDSVKRERLGRAARERGAHFSVERMVHETVAIYEMSSPAS